MTERPETDDSISGASPLKLPCDPSDASASVKWLRSRYMKNVRDPIFNEALEEVLETDLEGRLTSSPQRIGLIKETRGVLVIGHTGDGKTALIRRNLTRHSLIGLSDGIEPGKALYLRVPPEATLKGVATDILTKTGYGSVNEKIRTSVVWDMVAHRLAVRGITILWLDEAHHMLREAKEIAPVLRRMKSLMQGENSLVLIVSGIKFLDDKIRTDPETSERFSRVLLGPIRSDQERRDLHKFIERCCSFVDLAPVTDPDLVARLEFATRGSIGRSIEFCHSAILRALRRGDRQLTLDDFRRGFDLKRGFSDDGPFDPEDWPVLKDILEKKGWSA